MRIYVCADDYGMSEMTANRIERCVEEGVLNKISVFPNISFAGMEQSLTGQKAFLSVHLNLVEGHSVCPQSEVPLLTDDAGVFRYSFIELYQLALSTKRRVLREQAYRELRAQLQRAKRMLPQGELMLDSHQHTHMIPVIFEALMRAIRDEGVKVSYLRIPSEPILPYLRAVSLYPSYRITGIIKQWLLRYCAMRNRKQLKQSGIPTAYFMGVLFSGHMDMLRVSKILPSYIKLAKQRGQDIEILLHPGYSKPDEPLFEGHQKSFEAFYRSEGRLVEYQTARKLRIPTINIEKR